MPERELLVRIVGDDRDLQRALTSTDRRLENIDRRTQSFGRNIGRAFAVAGITVGAAALFDTLGDAIDQASALNEEISKSRQIFGDSSAAIERWAETTSTSFGVSERAALQATGVFGNLFRVVEIAPEQAATMSRALVQLAADLASFNNADPSDVLAALRSGLAGEAEPLRRFGVFLSEARVQMAAMAATGKENVKELSQQEKAIARYNIILQDTAIAQGDFQRTSGGLANQSRILRAQLEDLSAELGQNLLPVLIQVTRAANGLFHAFDALGTGLRFEGLTPEDLTMLQDLRAELVGVTGDSNLMVRALDDAIQKIQEFNAQERPRPDDRPGIRGPGAIDITNAQVDARNAERAARAAEKAGERRQKAFDELILGLELKLDRARLTKSVQDDIAILREIERAIRRRIKEEGRTFDLVDQLTQVQLRIAAEVGDAQSEADRKQVEALERRQDQQEREDQRRLQRVRDRAKQRQRDQFEALGLTAEGDRPTPGTGALLRRARSLQNQVKGTPLDTEKTRSELERIVKFLRKNFGKTGKEVREAILGMLNDISSAFEEGPAGSKSGPLTKTSGLNTKKILDGLGLSEEEIRELRGRLSSINTAGRQLANVSASAPGGARIREAGFGNNPIFVESTTTINLDGQQVAKVVTKQQQKTKRRNPQQKRGPNRNR